MQTLMTRFHFRRGMILCILVLSFINVLLAETEDAVRAPTPSKHDDTSAGKPKKSLTDYTDAEIERIFEQWEENDEDPVDLRDLPEGERRRRDPLNAPKVDLTKVNLDNKDEAIRLLKKGQTVMIFVQLTERGPSGGAWTDRDVNLYGQRWQTDLYNAHIDVQRYNVAARRILYVVADGALSTDIKNYLIRQAECEYVMIDGVQFDCAGKKTTKTEL